VCRLKHWHAPPMTLSGREPRGPGRSEARRNQYADGLPACGSAQLGRAVESTGVRQSPGWQVAKVIELVDEAPRTKTIVLEVQDRRVHRPGQHVDVRLAAEDGYQVQRSYSIASAPDDRYLALTVQRLDGGEVSPYLVDELRRGDGLELRGPVGDYFTWNDDVADPLLLVADGPGIAPIRSILRHHGMSRSTTPVRLLYSAPSYDEVIYREELLRIAARDEMDVSVTLTRDQPPGWHGYRGRVGRDLLREVDWPAEDRPLAYVSGPTGFVEATASALIALGHEASRIRAERFGRAS
jgi:ferredoxin-NADP reductase